MSWNLSHVPFLAKKNAGCTGSKKILYLRDGRKRNGMHFLASEVCSFEELDLFLKSWAKICLRLNVEYFRHIAREVKITELELINHLLRSFFILNLVYFQC